MDRGVRQPDVWTGPGALSLGPYLRDAGDELVLEAAVKGRAGVLVAFKRKDCGAVPSHFGVEVLSPGDALRRGGP